MKGKTWIIHGEGYREKLVPTLETSGQHLFLTHTVQLKFVKLTLNNLLCDWFINLLLTRIIQMETESQWGISDIVWSVDMSVDDYLNKVNWCGSTSPLRAEPYLWQGFLNYVRMEKLIQTLGKQANKIAWCVFISLFSSICVMWSILSRLSWWVINWNCKMNKFSSFYVAIPQGV